MMAPIATKRTEKRREQRRRASGTVVVRCPGPSARQIEGRLIDVSASGFRMAHAEASLEAGQVVEFTHQEAAGTARVMWNRIVNRNVETGFLLISRE
jgi:hypothetical protein